MDIGAENSTDPALIGGIIQAFKKAARVAQSFSSSKLAQQLAQSLVYSHFNVAETYNDGRSRYGVSHFEALTSDASIFNELQTIKLKLLELAETLRDYGDEPSRFPEAPFLTLQKTSEDARDGILAILEKSSGCLPQALPIPERRSSVPPTPPPKDDNYLNGAVGGDKNNDRGEEKVSDLPWMQTAAELGRPPINTVVRSSSPKTNRRMAYISDPKSAISSRSASPLRTDRRAAYIWDPKSAVDDGEDTPNWIPKEEVDQRININETWLHQRQMSRIAFRAESITSEYSNLTSPCASLASGPGSPEYTFTTSPVLFQEPISTTSSVNSEDFSRYSLRRLNPPDLIYDHVENKIIMLNRPEQKSLAETKPQFNRRGTSEEDYRFDSSPPYSKDRTEEDNKSPRTASLLIMGQRIEDGLQLADSRNTIYPTKVYEDGLILADESQHPTDSITIKSTDDKSLSISPSASFYQYGGFCPGALMLQSSQSGSFGICKKPSGNYNASVTGKCIKCAYEVSWQAMEKDRLNDLGSIYSHPPGIRWRQRFLQKCHLSVKNSDDAMYACIFCIEEGRTLEIHDATVFFSVQQLFRHLEKHADLPRPTVKIDVLTGYDGIEGCEFDIHFLDKGLRKQVSELDSVARKLEGLATGRAIASHRPRSSNFKSRDPFGSPTLQFAKGALIIGLSYPPHFSGVWASGYHDGQKSLFPANLIQLIPPTHKDGNPSVPMSPKSTMVAIARWDFKPLGSKNVGSTWLSFSKKERITNVGARDEEDGAESWCWSGMNAKGRWGLFPKVFVEVEKGGSGGLDGGSKGSGRRGIKGGAAVKGTVGNVFFGRKASYSIG